MVVGIVGAGLSGLVAGKKLALAGHDVTVIEKSRSLGGRLATLEEGEEHPLFDYGISHFTASDPAFKAFTDELIQKGLAAEWTKELGYYDRVQLFDKNPNVVPEQFYVAPKGMQAIARYLSRWVDVKTEGRAGSLTHIGIDRRTKRSWMLSLTDISTLQFDAVIVAAPAPEAYGILQTAQDETAARRIIRHIDEVQYASCYTVMAAYPDQEKLPWQAVECDDDDIEWVIDQNSKLKIDKGALVIHSTHSFVRQNVRTGEEQIAEKLVQKAADVTGESWIAEPTWKKAHFWKYSRAINPLREAFMELEMKEAPLALIGDYLGGNSMESAYLSGHQLAEYWIHKYSEIKAT